MRPAPAHKSVNAARQAAGTAGAVPYCMHSAPGGSAAVSSIPYMPLASRGGYKVLR
jgi:hypothetical protein